jgi:hypothetical protein
MLDNPAGIVYGALIIGALLDAESARSATYGDTVGGVVISLILLWLAHAYAASTAWRLKRRERLEATAVGEALVHEVSILVGGAPSLLAVLIAWAVGAALSSAVTAAVWTSAGVIVVVEVAAGISAQLPRRAFAVQLTFGVLLGIGLIALKSVLHG